MCSSDLNVWQGTVKHADEHGLRVDTPFGEFHVERQSGSRFGQGETVLLVARPEKFHLAPAGSPAGPNARPVRIETSMFAGPHTEYQVVFGVVGARVWIHDEDANAQLHEGMDAQLWIEPSRLRLLPVAGR